MLESKRLFIRFVEHDDYKQMIEYMCNEEVMKYELNNHMTKEDVMKFVDECVDSQMIYTCFLKGSNKLIGHIYLGPTNPHRFNEYNLGYIFNPKFHNQGYATEAAKAIMKYGFVERGIHRIIAKCNPNNIASWKVMEKINMRREGHFLKRVCFRNDEDGNPIYWDEYFYAMLQEEWYNFPL